MDEPGLWQQRGNRADVKRIVRRLFAPTWLAQALRVEPIESPQSVRHGERFKGLHGLGQRLARETEVLPVGGLGRKGGDCVEKTSAQIARRSEEHTSELQSQSNLV